MSKYSKYFSKAFVCCWCKLHFIPSLWFCPIAYLPDPVLGLILCLILPQLVLDAVSIPQLCQPASTHLWLCHLTPANLCLLNPYLPAPVHSVIQSQSHTYLLVLPCLTED